MVSLGYHVHCDQNKRILSLFIILDSRYKVTVIEWPLWCFPLPTDTDTELSRTLGPHGLLVRQLRSVNLKTTWYTVHSKFICLFTMPIWQIIWNPGTTLLCVVFFCEVVEFNTAIHDVDIFFGRANIDSEWCFAWKRCLNSCLIHIFVVKYGVHMTKWIMSVWQRQVTSAQGCALVWDYAVAFNFYLQQSFSVVRIVFLLQSGVFAVICLIYKTCLQSYHTEMVCDMMISSIYKCQRLKTNILHIIQ